MRRRWNDGPCFADRDSCRHGSCNVALSRYGGQCSDDEHGRDARCEYSRDRQSNRSGDPRRDAAISSCGRPSTASG